MSDPISTLGIAELKRQLDVLRAAVLENTKQISELIGILQGFMEAGATENEKEKEDG